MTIRSPKDFWAGFLYATLAAAFLWFGREYRTGVASRMGPGYFPLTLGWVLFGFGLISMARSCFVEGTPIGGIAWRALAWVSAGVVAFGLVLPRLGLVFALPTLVILSALASRQSRFDLRSLAALAGLIAFCILVFVKGLGVPMPILGSWFDGLVPSNWQ